VEDLTPFKSLLVVRSPKVLAPDLLVGSIGPQLQTLATGKWLKSMSAVAGPVDNPHVYVAFFTYVEERPVSWARLSDLRDILNHLVVVCLGKGKAKRHLAMFFSDNLLRDRAAEKISKQEGALGELEPIAPGTMNAAYLAGQAVTLWLSGTHRRVASKVDNKVISGMDLQYALDPLGDQSFFYTAARARLPGGGIEQAVGSSPRRSRLWIGPSRDWDDFSKTVGTLLGLVVEATVPVANPLPVLSSPLLEAKDMGPVQGAYDMAFIPPELMDPASAAPETIEERERLGAVVFEVSSPTGAGFSFAVYHPVGTAIGTADLAFTLAAGGRASWTLSNEAPAGTNDELFQHVIGALGNRRGWLKVWYDSGHTLADEGFFEGRFRDQAFGGYLWESFAGIDIGKEKPTPLSRATIGAEDSLFCWVRNRWTVPNSEIPPGQGWLACDDGSMEKADFLHIDTVAGVPTLSLIHVKASGARDPGRRLSVSDYEIVTGQAVKNLRWVDRAVLGTALQAALTARIGNKVWHHGAPATAAAFLGAVAALRANYARNVVILQPRARRSVVNAARTAAGRERLRLAQLDTLLLGARANVVGLNANLYVIGEDA
jgi:hypothetical protein